MGRIPGTCSSPTVKTCVNKEMDIEIQFLIKINAGMGAKGVLGCLWWLTLAFWSKHYQTKIA